MEAGILCIKLISSDLFTLSCNTLECSDFYIKRCGHFGMAITNRLIFFAEQRFMGLHESNERIDMSNRFLLLLHRETLWISPRSGKRNPIALRRQE